MNHKLNDNPYLQSRALWSDIYGTAQERLQNAHRILIALVLVIIIMALGMVRVGMQSKVRPYVAVLHGNDMLMLQPNESLEPGVRSKLSLMLANEFIIHARSYSSDDTMNQQYRVQSLAVVSNQAAHSLQRYWQTQALAQNTIRQVVVKTVLMRSEKTIAIRWVENTLESETGNVVSAIPYFAEFQVQYGEPSSNLELQKYNPFGFYVTQLVWSQDSIKGDML